MERLQVPQGEFELARYPARRNDTLRAWDAADEFVLHHLAEVGAAGGTGALLVVNGGSGCLAVALAGRRPVLTGDSYLDHLATRENLARNGLDAESVRHVPALQALPADLATVVVKVPKSLALLEEQLRGLRPALRPDSVVVGAGMTKHIHTSTVDAFERIIGPTTTSRAKKKARLVLATVDPARPVDPSPWPLRREDPGGLTVLSHAGVFSAERLDIGTRFLLEHLPPTSRPIRIVDLGCGNGVVGLAAAMANPEAHVTFIDESYLAVASAEATYHANVDGPREGSARFVVGDAVFHLADGEPIERGSVDLVLNNPPFHDDHALSDETAWRMFTEAHGALVAGGELRVVGNRHLAYHAKLKRIFGNCDVVASNSKFVVFRATK